MAELLKNNQTFRSCILYEVLIGRSVEDAYKNMCKALKNDKLDYVDFEYWFYRLYNGNLDMNNDRSSNPEPLSFSDLPNEILGEIVEKLDLVSRLKTRKVSRTLRSVVDKQNAYYKSICISTDKNRVDIGFDGVLVHYGKSGYLIDDKDYGDLKRKFIEDDNFMKIALNDLTIALKKPKLQLECLTLFFDSDADAESSEILKLIESLKYPIHLTVFLFKTDGNQDPLPILSLSKPGTLEHFAINCVDSSLNVDQLVKMDQWKQAKVAQIGDIHERPVPVDIEDFLHFDRFFFFVDSLSPNDVLRLRDVFSKSASFEKCDLEFRASSVNLDEIGRALGATVVQTRSGPTIHHLHSIPGSKKFLEFNFNRQELSIERKP